MDRVKNKRGRNRRNEDQGQAEMEKKRKIEPTCGVNEGRVELLGEKGVRHVPEELLQQSSHVVNAVLLVQRDVNAAIKLLT